MLKIDAVGEDAIRRMSDYRPPRKKRKGSSSKIGDDVRGRHRDEACTAGADRHSPS